jgi:hypothetical protein
MLHDGLTKLFLTSVFWKGHKFGKISNLFWSYWVNKLEIFQIFAAFSQNLYNFLLFFSPEMLPENYLVGSQIFMFITYIP